MIEKIRKTEDEWRRILSEEQYEVMRGRGTEKPFSCAWDGTKKGEYRCAACDLPLFETKSKFESGSGWPSFFEPIADDRLELINDQSDGMVRTEVRCARCDSHLGHVFSDGPAPTGKRYCINSKSLKFIQRDES